MKKIEIKLDGNYWTEFKIGDITAGYTEMGAVESIATLNEDRISVSFEKGHKVFEGFPHITTYNN